MLVVLSATLTLVDLFFFFAVIKVTVSVGVMQLEVSEHLCR